MPVIWHDDSVIMHQSEGSDIRSTEIKDMDLASFKQVVCNAESSEGKRDQLVRMFRGVQTRAEIPGGYLAW